MSLTGWPTLCAQTLNSGSSSESAPHTTRAIVDGAEERGSRDDPRALNAHAELAQLAHTLRVALFDVV